MVLFQDAVNLFRIWKRKLEKEFLRGFDKNVVKDGLVFWKQQIQNTHNLRCRSPMDSSTKVRKMVSEIDLVWQL